MEVPEGLSDLLQQFTIAVLRTRPKDLIKFASEYFNNMLQKQSMDAPQKDSAPEKDNKTGKLKKLASFEATVKAPAEDELRELAPAAPRPKPQFQRRKSVASERYDPEADKEPVTKVLHPKSDEQRERLMEAVVPILLFRSLDPEQMKEVVDAMFERKVVPGEDVIVEGTDGDNFYVIDSGSYDIFVGGTKYGEYNNKGSFGELALMYNQPRAATIVATTDGTLWAMDRSVFRRIVLRNAYNRRKMYESLIENVPMLKFLNQFERMNVADALATRYFKDGDCIIKQGDQADCMYFVEDGKVKITAHSFDGEEDKEITEINKGGFFGVLDIAAFERLMGPCMDIMKRNIDYYEEQMISVFGSKTDVDVNETNP